MSNYFKQYIPGFVSDVEPINFEFNTLEELINHDVVKRWSLDPFDENEPSPLGWFHRYSLSENRLMAEFKYGKEWYVIGYIKNPDKLDLPKFERPKKHRN